MVRLAFGLTVFPAAEETYSCRVYSQDAGRVWRPVPWPRAIPAESVHCLGLGTQEVSWIFLAAHSNWQPTGKGKVPSWPLRHSGCPEAHEEECAADCCSHRHRELEMERHGGSTGCEIRPTPAAGRDPTAGRAWGQRELLERGGGTSICRGTCRMGNLHLQGSCGIEHPFLFPPQHTGVIFLLGWCPLVTAFIHQLLREGGFFVQAGECMKPAQVLPKELSLLLLHCLAPLAKLYSHLNLHKNSTRVQQIMQVYTLLIWRSLILLFYNAMT